MFRCHLEDRESLTVARAHLKGTEKILSELEPDCYCIDSGVTVMSGVSDHCERAEHT